MQLGAPRLLDAVPRPERLLRERRPREHHRVVRARRARLPDLKQWLVGWLLLLLFVVVTQYEGDPGH